MTTALILSEQHDEAVVFLFMFFYFQHLKKMSFIVWVLMLSASQQGAGTDEHALIEILVTRSNEQIHAMNAAYQAGEFDENRGFRMFLNYFENL